MPPASTDIRTFFRENRDAVKVEIVVADGSTPREKGAWMLVSPAASFRTIGGGQLEYMAMDHARTMLREGGDADRIAVPLGPEIGQCCGGRVELDMTRIGEELAGKLIAELDRDLAGQPHVYLFGAGHVGNALARALALLPVRTVLVDTRAGEIENAPGEVETRLTAVPESIVREAPAGSAFVVLTHDHSLDFLIVSEALGRRDAAYVGMIGSKTKRATFRNWYLKRNDGREDMLKRLISPIGGSNPNDKRPAVIAGLAAAELIEAVGGRDVERTANEVAAAG